MIREESAVIFIYFLFIYLLFVVNVKERIIIIHL